MDAFAWLFLGICLGAAGAWGVHAAIRRWPRFQANSEAALAEEIRTIVNEGERDGLLEEEARDMIEGVFELGDAVVVDVMTPRTEMISFPSESTWDECVKFAAAAGHSRIPITGKSRDEVVGLLHIKDLLIELAKPETARRRFREILRKPYFVPETKAVVDLLRDFQRARNHLAIVLDEYGGVSGLVTIEDVLEKIVGEIDDEHDEQIVEPLSSVGEHRWEALGRARIQEVNEKTGLQLPEEADFDTLGGFVFHELARIPHVGEELVWKNARLRVLDATRRRIDRLLIEVLAEKENPENAQPTADSGAG